MLPFKTFIWSIITKVVNKINLTIQVHRKEHRFLVRDVMTNWQTYPLRKEMRQDVFVKCECSRWQQSPTSVSHKACWASKAKHDWLTDRWTRDKVIPMWRFAFLAPQNSHFLTDRSQSRLQGYWPWCHLKKFSLVEYACQIWSLYFL